MRYAPLLLTAGVLVACDAGLRREMGSFLREYDQTYQKLYAAASQAEWNAETKIVEGDSATPARAKQTKEELAKFVGSIRNIERLRGYLNRQDRLDPLVARRLEVMLYNAADAPQTVAEVVKRRIALETDQIQRLYGFDFKLHGRSVAPNRIDEILRKSNDPAERLAAWGASKAVGSVLKPGMAELRDLRNATVRALQYADYFAYQVSDYGMTTGEMLALADTLVTQLRPLYRELHTWTRYELARRYRQPVPDLIPAHWLPNRWAQDWSDLVDVPGMDVDAALTGKTAEWVVRQAERFYRSLGFDSLGAGFWEKSSLYPPPAGAKWKKNTHASAWHLDLDRDIRSLMSVEPNTYWYGAAHHELGHIFYFLSYTRPDVPLVLRQGANRAYHEGVGTMIELASSQRRFLAGRGLVPAGSPPEPMRQLLEEALNYVVFVPFSAGTMTRFEHALYAENLPAEEFNQAWWEYVRKYQGVAPPSPRDERYADGLTKTHITDDPAQYYDYALSYALLFQLHEHIARTILSQDPHDTDYYGSRATGDFLRAIMSPGASRPWREVLRQTTGRALDARAIVDYFQLLYQWLVEQNRGRRATLP